MNQLGADARSYMLSVTRRILRCEEAAADATQDAMLLAHRHRDKFRGESAYRTWLYRIAVTTALQYLRKKKRSREDLVLESPDAPAFDPRSSSPSPEHLVAMRQLADRARDMLAAIDDKHRDVFELRVDDHTETEIAARLEISVANVKIRAHRTRKKLRDSLCESYSIDADLALSA